MGRSAHRGAGVLVNANPDCVLSESGKCLSLIETNQKIKPHHSMLFGYSHFWDSDFIQQTGFSENADLLYAQYSFKS